MLNRRLPPLSMIGIDPRTPVFDFLPGLRCALGLAAAVCFSLAWQRVDGAEDPAPLAGVSVLHLTNGGHVAGDLRDSDGPGRLGWQSPHFTAPFDFEAGAVNAVHFPLPEQLPRASGEFRFELPQGDILFGSLVAWNAGELELEVPHIGRVHLRQSDLHRFSRWRDSADLVYLGPNGMAGWTAAGGKGWREEFGHLISDQDASFLRGDFEVPVRAVIEVELSWRKKPDFAFALGVGDASDEKVLQQAWRFEVWENDLVVKGETDAEADVGLVQKITTGPGRAHLIAYLDQAAGRCLVFSPAGEQLADVAIAGGKPPVLSGLRLDNKRGDLRLERLRIARWAGELPKGVQTDKPRVERSDGEIVYGTLASFDAAAREFIIRGEKSETRVPAGQVGSAVLAAPPESEARAMRVVYQDGTQVSGELTRLADGFLWLKSPAARQPLRLPVKGLRSLIVLRHESAPSSETGPTGLLEIDGARLRGRLVDGNESASASCLVWQPLGSSKSSPLRHGVSGRIVYREPPPPKQRPQGTAAAQGRVRVLGGRVAGGAAPGAMPGMAAAAPARAAAGAVPDEGPEAAKIRRALDLPTTVEFLNLPLKDCLEYLSDYHGIKIEFDRDALKAEGVKIDPPVTLQLANVPLRNVFRLLLEPVKLTQVVDGNVLRITTQEKARAKLAGAALPTGRRALHLRSGDTIVCDVTGIDENGVFFRTPMSEATFVAHDKVKAVELVHEATHSIKLNKTKRERLLMLPRMQKASPPTQLIRSRSGDYLRGRVISLDDSKLRIEVRLETAEIPRDRIAEIIWLHADELGDAPASQAAPQADDVPGTRVQTLRSDGIRLTFIADKVSDASVAGASDVLGVCRVALNQVDQLLFGGAIEQAAAQLAYHQWKLHNAPEPKFMQADGSEESETGTDSPLVGKPAPEFELALLDGKRFRLAEARGHVVVLDFWATWCGPCLQAMPQVDRAVREFADQGVQLIAVNQEETPRQINGTLERHKLELTVALDRDASVGAKYQAASIPQTVIIDAKGNVARVYVGGGPHTYETIRDALQAVLAPADAPQNAPPAPADDAPKGAP